MSKRGDLDRHVRGAREEQDEPRMVRDALCFAFGAFVVLLAWIVVSVT